MSVIADLIRAGVDPDLVARVAEEIAEARALGAARSDPARTARQERNARYYDGKKERLKASETVLNETIKTASASPQVSPEVSPQEIYNQPPILTPSSPPQSSLRSDDARTARLRLMAREFDQIFWPEWPNKVGKPVALKAFAKARDSASLDQIMSGLRAYIASRPSDRPWLNPATFLNQERFNDQPAAALPRACPAGSGRNLFAEIAFGGGGYDEFTDGTMGQRGGLPGQANASGDGTRHRGDDEPADPRWPKRIDL